MNWQPDKGAEKIYNIVAYPDGVSAITFRDVDSSLIVSQLNQSQKWGVSSNSTEVLLSIRSAQDERKFATVDEVVEGASIFTLRTVIRANREDIICGLLAFVDFFNCY